MLMRSVVIESADNDRSTARHQHSRVGAFLRLAHHPSHRAVIATFEPFAQMLSLRLQALGRNDADGGESELECLCFDLGGTNGHTSIIRLRRYKKEGPA